MFEDFKHTDISWISYFSNTSFIIILYNYNSILQFYSTTRKPYSPTLTYCPICKLGLEIVNLNSLPPLNFPPTRTTQSTRILPVAAIEQETVNA